MKPTQGTILISEPFLNDHYFRRSVILLAEHNNKGSFGLIINKPTNIKLNEVVKDFPLFDTNLYIGGPVNTNSLFILHTLGNKIENSIKIINGLYWGGNIEQIKALIKADKISKDKIRFFVGYSGWEAEQLNKELNERSWIITKAKLNFMFYEPPDDIWKNVVKSLGQEYAMWANYPIDPSMN